MLVHYLGIHELCRVHMSAKVEHNLTTYTAINEHCLLSSFTD